MEFNSEMRGLEMNSIRGTMQVEPTLFSASGAEHTSFSVAPKHRPPRKNHPLDKNQETSNKTKPPTGID